MKRFYEGKNAFYRGILDNPYPTGSDEAKDWENGFNRAYFEQQEKVSKRYGQTEKTTTTKTFA